MGASLFGNSQEATTAVNVTAFHALGSSTRGNQSVQEITRTSRANSSYTFSNFHANVTANSFTLATMTLRSRKNSANGNMTVSYAAGVTGLVSDTTNTDSITAADTYGTSTVVPNTGTGTALVRTRFQTLSSSLGNLAVFAAQGGSLFTPAAGGTFMGVAGAGQVGNPENDVKVQLDVGGVLSNLQTDISGNTTGVTTTLVSRINNATGNQTVSITSNTTGVFEDTTNSDTVVAGDDINMMYSATGAASGLTVALHSMQFLNTSSRQNNIYNGMQPAGASRAASATASFYAPLGIVPATNITTESAMNIQHFFPCLNSMMKVYITANTYSVAATMTSRKNSGAGNQTISITAGATGLFEDTTNSDALGANDDFCFSIVGGSTGAASLQWMGSLEQDLTTNIKNINGLAYASTKAWNGLSTASIKSINGLA